MFVEAPTDRNMSKAWLMTPYSNCKYVFMVDASKVMFEYSKLLASTIIFIYARQVRKLVTLNRG